MDSLQGNVPGFNPRRSPRIIDQQQRDTFFHLLMLIAAGKQEMNAETQQKQVKNSLLPLRFDHKTMELEPVQ
ncbi:hypothetical protein MKX03_032130 [Papaver bracteatum]|nr:hypothetical protein MKX03_032130 [Papaver bracteatum]